MKALLELARDLLWLRRGPQDLPYSPSLSFALFVAACTIDLVQSLMSPGLQGNLLARVLLSNALMIGLPWLALNVAGLHARFAQVAGTLCLVSFVFGILFFPLIVLGALDASAKDSASHQLAAIGQLILVCWFITVEGHILRHALKLPLPIAIVIALTFVVTGNLVSEHWLGPSQPPVAADAAKPSGNPP
jgi:hypothetical protein